MEIDLKIILVQQWHGFGKQGRILPYAATQANPFDAVGSTYLLADNWTNLAIVLWKRAEMIGAGTLACRSSIISRKTF